MVIVGVHGFMCSMCPNKTLSLENKPYPLLLDSKVHLPWKNDNK
jgi:hypothetical protein